MERDGDVIKSNYFKQYDVDEDEPQVEKLNLAILMADYGLDLQHLDEVLFDESSSKFS